ncbi:MAG: microcin C ABC transporter permease YejB [Alphaproteobacteria bacterium]|nr:microcin C ABC transporter permease YejB [Alphaproteobacteria bacterium]
MIAYILRRLGLIIPTLIGILLINFVIIQAAPGGPVEQMVAQLTQGNLHSAGASRVGGVTTDFGAQQAALQGQSNYRGAQGIDPELLEELKAQYGFDKLAYERFLQMVGDYITFDFGDSFFRDEPVIGLILDKLPVSISLGLWTTLLVYLVSIPLGIRKAVKDGSRFDIYSSALVVIGQAIPGFLFAILLLILFAGGSYWQIFPLRGITSDNWESLSLAGKVIDYFWHITLPVISMVIGGFASLTLLTKNSFIEEISKHYVMTARAKGLPESRVLYRHVFRNAMLIVIAGIPSALIAILFTSSLLIEVIFSLDGLGLLGFEAALTRDYPVMFGTLFIFTLIGLVFKILGDITYMLVDPRIDFERRGA